MLIPIFWLVTAVVVVKFDIPISIAAIYATRALRKVTQAEHRSHAPSLRCEHWMESHGLMAAANRWAARAFWPFPVPAFLLGLTRPIL